MAQIIRLYHAERVILDQKRLSHLVEEHGQAGTERLIGRAMEEIAVRLTRIENAFTHGEIARVRHGAEALIDIADHTGLVSLCRLAKGVSALATTQDSTALAAVVARLIRVGEMSLVTIWDVHDISV